MEKTQKLLFTPGFCTKRSFGIFLVCLLFFTSAALSHAAPGGGDSLGVRTVVIDPGHGGKDPGCVGKFSHEADVVLAISLKLGDMIKEKYGNSVKVIYTRTKDEFVDLAERARIANKHKADLFICIHANAGPATAKGTETYVLGLHKSAAQFKVAERENSVIMIEDNYEQKYQNFDPRDPDNFIFLSLMTSTYLEQSISFARRIQENAAQLPVVYNRGVKQAGFLVLHQVNMPSVLIEVGFLTHPEEEKVLNDVAHQKLMAKSIFDAFVDYKTEVEGRNQGTKLTLPDKKVTPEEVTQKEEPVVAEEPVKDNKVVFKVQITTSPKPLDVNSSAFKGLKGVEMYRADGIYKYTYGKSDNFEEAKKLQTEAREKGFGTAFIIAFLNGERIELQKAIELAKR